MKSLVPSVSRCLIIVVVTLTLISCARTGLYIPPAKALMVENQGYDFIKVKIAVGLGGAFTLGSMYGSKQTFDISGYNNFRIVIEQGAQSYATQEINLTEGSSLIVIVGQRIEQTTWWIVRNQ
jgi:hypothetical protein